MRFEELVLRIPEDEFRIRFHEHLTVLSGIGMLERQALADSVIGALSGTAESTLLTYTDYAGRRIQLASAGDGRAVAAYLDDRTAAPPPNGSIAPDVSGMRSLMLIHADDVGLVATTPRSDDPPELAEARTTLASLTEELQSALAGRQEADQLRRELEVLDAQLRAAEDGDARREYARVLADLERVRAEAAALVNGAHGADADRRLLAVADEARELAAAWSRADGARRELRRASGDGPPLDPEVAARARTIPPAAPQALAALLHSWTSASRDHAELEARVRGLAAARLPDPSSPRVVDLATIDQSSLWGARQRVLEARARLELEQLRLGGLDPASTAAATGAIASVAKATDELEAAHAAVETARYAVRRRTIPTLVGLGTAAVLALLVADRSRVAALVLLVCGLATAAAGIVVPRRRLAAATKRERDALDRTGAPTYLGFHIRRIDAVVDPDARRRLDVAAAEHLDALHEWQEIAHGIGLDEAGALEAEVRSYAAALAGMGSAADEMQALHHQLVDVAEPAVAAARAALAAECEPFGIDAHEVALALESGAEGLSRLVTQQANLGAAARAGAELEQAEAESTELTEQLAELLARQGFREGVIEARIGALAWAVEQAVEREDARSRARPMVDVEADLARLQATAARTRRPEWATVNPSDGDESDLPAAAERREAIAARLAELPHTAIDLERLADRRAAMERRVAALESRLASGHSEATVAQMADVQHYLLAHLTRAGHVGPHDEPVPVLLDEPFLRIAAERKWELLDALRRMAERTQLIYLTDDPFVTAWARRRAAAGLILLLEPVAEPA